MLPTKHGRLAGGLPQGRQYSLREYLTIRLWPLLWVRIDPQKTHHLVQDALLLVQARGDISW
jgi:hypothetical protein